MIRLVSFLLSFVYLFIDESLPFTDGRNRDEMRKTLDSYLTDTVRENELHWCTIKIWYHEEMFGPLNELLWLKKDNSGSSCVIAVEGEHDVCL